MKKSPKYGVGSKVAYKDENGSKCEGCVYRIAEVGRECFHYGVDCEDGKKRFLYEAKLIETEKINE